MPDGKSRGASGETPIGDQGTGLAQSLRFQVAGRVEHLLHTRPTFRTFVTDQYDIAFFYPVRKDRLDGGILTLEDPGRTGKHQDRLVHPRGLDDTPMLGKIAVQHGQAAVLRISVLDITDTALAPVEIQLRPLT